MPDGSVFPAKPFFDAVYRGSAPWDIGAPQPDLRSLDTTKDGWRMIDPIVLEIPFMAPANIVWGRLLKALEAVPGATLKAADENRFEIRFSTGVSATSWGENMVASVESAEGGSSILQITGQVRHTFLTTTLGELIHRRVFTRRLLRQLEPLL